ncbi:variant surface glycoprotein (VSG, atypical), putative [Trypanosoma brucei brucei TREU927]|uniref:Variant surface glycoprotein (VSG, atypical), putative n=1 Tax=Trypanosoma brucei brucei (strain 927/4 GUTat10.1) TaxID=185431 RepID=Q380X5_TRYB2|nr:variant surface glycoprotein [Trypanosoma brucei brucei TREU927]EAN80656.1 variant surface glycoprotein (VSG, atypical), putative [Trypanosoma brucei brucei TREU927]
MASSIVVMLAIIARLAYRASGTANEAVPAYHTLCAVVNIARGEPTTPEDTEGAAISQEITLLTELNITVADDDFYNQDFKEDPNNKITEANWVKHRAAWHAAKKNLQNNKVEKHGLKITRPLNSHARQAAAVVINRTLEMALERRKDYKPLKKTGVEEALLTALYGPTEALSQKAGETFGASGVNACSAPGSGTAVPGMSLASDLVCMFGSNSGSNKAEECLGTQGGQDCQYNDQSGAHTCFPQLLAGFPAAGKAKVSAAAIQAAIGAFITGLKDKGGSTQANNLILGTANSVNCNGVANAGCVKYKATSTGTVPIPWMRHLETAATKLAEHAEQRSKNMASLAEIRHLRSIAIQEYLKALKGDQPQLQKIAGDQTAHPKKKEPECNKHQSKTECTEPCKWNENATDASKKCSLDPQKAKEQAAGTEDGAAGEQKTDSKCSEKKKQEDCKDGCKWEDNKCKDSSILVNKQLALSVVSAAFVALLF